jgi:hypothetical protein
VKRPTLKVSSFGFKRRGWAVDRVDTGRQVKGGSIPGSSKSFFSYPKCLYRFSLFHRALQFTIYNGPTNALACNRTLIQMSQTKTLKITPTCFDHQMIIIRDLFDPG